MTEPEAPKASSKGATAELEPPSGICERGVMRTRPMKCHSRWTALRVGLELFALVFGALMATPAGAGHRVALIIGNAQYTSLSPLRNAVRDAELMQETLQEIGFETLTGLDLSKAKQDQLIAEFIKRASAIEAGGIILIYYAGHAIQYKGENFLLAIDVAARDEAGIELQATSASDLLRQVSSVNQGVTLAILDSCRDNPFGSSGDSFKGTAAGLAPIEAGNGVFVAYATAPGFVAYDGAGKNSPFTSALSDALLLPGQPIEAVMKLVGTRVQSETGGLQTPWSTSSLTREFILNPVRFAKVNRSTIHIFDEGRSYSMNYAPLDGITLLCGATQIAGSRGEVFGRQNMIEQVRPFYGKDHVTVFHAFQKFGLPYHCQLFCALPKAVYCRNVDVLQALVARLRVVSELDKYDSREIVGDTDRAGSTSRLGRVTVPILDIRED